LLQALDLSFCFILGFNGSSQDEAKATLVQAEGEVARLQSVVSSLHTEA
jgi:hypothetical protein